MAKSFSFMIFFSSLLNIVLMFFQKGPAMRIPHIVPLEVSHSD